MVKNLTPGVFNFTLGNSLCIFRGASWNVYFSANDRDEEGNLFPIDLTGCVGRCTIKPDALDPVIIATPKVTIEDPENGKFALSLTDEETSVLPLNGETFRDTSIYQYDVYFDNDNGESYRVLQGYVEVSPNMTNKE